MHQQDNRTMKVLGIESSCDETGVAIYDTALPVRQALRAHQLYSQTALHAQYGGVVPELASRDHVRKLLPLVQRAYQQAALAYDEIDAIAYTAGPGLAGALLVGVSFAQAFAWGINKPAIAIHHLEGHLLSGFMMTNPPTFPFVALLVSGGHTMLLWVQGIGNYQLLGETLDDAVGEAFDKTAKLLGLPYPGGPQLAALATTGTANRFHFTRPMLDRRGLDFSFSGLKTQVAMAWRQSDQSQQSRADIARGFEDAVIETLMSKCVRALAQTGANTLVVSGGVGANQRLRDSLEQALSQTGECLCIPPPEYCTDNGAMIAFAGALRLQHGFLDASNAKIRPRWEVTSLSSVTT